MELLSESDHIQDDRWSTMWRLVTIAATFVALAAADAAEVHCHRQNALFQGMGQVTFEQDEAHEPECSHV